MRTLRPAGKLEQLTYAMGRFQWGCEIRLKNFSEVSTNDEDKGYFSGKEDRHEYGAGFLVHKDIVSAVLGYRPVTSRLISIRPRAAPFNITIIPTSGHDNSEVDHFYQQLQETIDRTPKKEGWSGGAKVLGKLPVPGRPTNLDYSRARAYCACIRCRWGLFGHFFSHLDIFFSHLSLLFSFSLSLGDGPI